MIDVRAEVLCSLGPVISANVSDDYLQGSGVIKTRGSVELQGAFVPAVGTTVNFSWNKPGGTTDLPRELRVLSSSVDPFRLVTRVELGCALTYFTNRKPPTTNPNSKEENSTVPCYVYNYATLPISASYVLEHCATALGLTLSSNPLTSKFSIEEFDLDPGYVQVIGDLLVSEGYFGMVRSGTMLEVFSLQDGDLTGPIITADDIIDLGPVGVGSLPGETARVKYTTRRLKVPTFGVSLGDGPNRNWEFVETFGSQTPVTATYQDSAGTTQSVTGSYTPYSASYSLYDRWDRLVETVSITKTSAADVNNQWAGDKASIGALFAKDVFRMTYEQNTYRWATEREPLPSGGTLLSSAQAMTTEELKQELNDKQQADTDPASSCLSLSSRRPERASELVRTVTETYISEMEAAGTLSLSSFKADDGSVIDLSGAATILSSVTEVTFDKDIASGITRTVTDNYTLAAKTIGGQQGLSAAAQFVYDPTTGVTSRATLGQLLARATQLSYIGAETNIRTEREYGLKRRPSQDERNNTANAKTEPVEATEETVWAVGSVETEATQEFSLPYAPDDVIGWTLLGGFTRTASDAKEKALAYGRIQNRLLLGNRYALSLQLDPASVPEAPFKPLYVQAAGLTGQYRTNGCSWAMTTDGVIASTDALYWGAVGADPGASAWVPLPPGMDAGDLPATSGSPSVVVAPFNETVVRPLAVRAAMEVQKFGYALTSLANAAMVAKANMIVTRPVVASTGAIVVTGQAAGLIKT
jgi:hypothetical protein